MQASTSLAILRKEPRDAAPYPFGIGDFMREIKKGTLYRHFKGNLYRVLATAKHTETDEVLVIYMPIKGDGTVYARPLDMFLSRIDREKYPDATQQDRFELIVE